jgi:hypothetical protein
MKYFSHSKLALLALTLASSFATSGALADYRLTAFSDTVGFQALLKKDLTEAETIFRISQPQKHGLLRSKQPVRRPDSS